MSPIFATLPDLLTLAQRGAGGGIALGFGVFGCVMALIWLALVVFWIWMIVDAATRTFPGENEKIIWILVVVLLGPLGAAIYFFVGRPKGTKGSGPHTGTGTDL